jgi:hypothetical protein
MNVNKPWKWWQYVDESPNCQCKNLDNKIAKMGDVVKIIPIDDKPGFAWIGKIAMWSDQGYPVVLHKKEQTNAEYFNGLNGTWIHAEG